MSRPRFVLAGLAALVALALACSRQASSPASPTAADAVTADETSAADGSTLKASAPVPTSPINDAQVTDVPTLTATASTMKYGTSGLTGPLQYRFQVFNDAGAMIQDSGLTTGPSFRVTATLDFKKRMTWRVRAESGGMVGPWSTVASFVTPEGGFLRGNQVFDPLTNGATVGQIIGPVTFLPTQGVRLEQSGSYIRYSMPVTINAGEFSLEVMGLRANGPGGKAKVMAMSSDNADFTTDPYRVDIQYRGVLGSPPNAITYRVLFGSADDLDVRYEPDTATRFNSVFSLNPNQKYFWRFTWGNGEVRVTVQEGGAKDNGRMFYNVGVRATKGSYNPRPHYVYIGAPTGRDGEQPTIPGTIYSNVYAGPGPRP
jgi:hypothetical protein